jgi:hypothetical protein
MPRPVLLMTFDAAITCAIRPVRTTKLKRSCYGCQNAGAITLCQPIAEPKTQQTVT